MHPRSLLTDGTRSTDHASRSSRARQLPCPLLSKALLAPAIPKRGPLCIPSGSRGQLPPVATLSIIRNRPSRRIIGEGGYVPVPRVHFRTNLDVCLQKVRQPSASRSDVVRMRFLCRLVLYPLQCVSIARRSPAHQTDSPAILPFSSWHSNPQRRRPDLDLLRRHVSISRWPFRIVPGKHFWRHRILYLWGLQL